MILKTDGKFVAKVKHNSDAEVSWQILNYFKQRHIYPTGKIHQNSPTEYVIVTEGGRTVFTLEEEKDE